VVELRVYNIHGEMVYHTSPEWHAEGLLRYELPSWLSTGVYFCHITAPLSAGSMYLFCDKLHTLTGQS